MMLQYWYVDRIGLFNGRFRKFRVMVFALSGCFECIPRYELSWHGRPLRWLRISSIVTFLVYSGSASTKSSGMTSETGVVHCMSGYVLSSTKHATAAAVVDLDILARSKSVALVHLLSGYIA